MTEREPEDMMFFITGGSASGKSEYAEKLAEKLAFSQGGGQKNGRKRKRSDVQNGSGTDALIPLLYLATMRNDGEEAQLRIERHRQQREGRGFQLLEAPTPDRLEDVPACRVILLDCLSNFTANTLFSDVCGNVRDDGCRNIGDGRNGGKTVLEVTEKILRLRDRCKHLVIVADAVFSDGMVYEWETERYIRILGDICAILARQAEYVIEVVFGLPVFLRKAERRKNGETDISETDTPDADTPDANGGGVSR